MSRKSSTTCIVSDIHFPHHMPKAWAAFREFHAETRPATTIIGGDFLDFAQLSTFSQDPKFSIYVIPEIQQFVREANALASECGELIVLEGNHEARWSRFIEPVAVKLRGAIGLTLREQCLAQGMNPRVTWYRESAENRGIRVQQMIFRHGDKDFGRYGGGKHAASNLIDKTFGGESPITGHLHQCQMICRRRADGVLVISICNGTFEKPADYAPQNNWIYSLTLVEKCSDTWGTPHPVVIEHGMFAYGGRVYDGNVAATAPAHDTLSDVPLPSHAPIPYYHPKREDSQALDRVAHLFDEMQSIRQEINAVTRCAGDAALRFTELDTTIERVDALPPPPLEPREERSTRDDHGTNRGRMVTHPITGETKSIASWARALNLTRTTLTSRLNSPRLSIEEALRPGVIAR